MKLQISALALVAALASTSAASAADAPSGAQLTAMKKLVASGQYKTAVAKLTSDYDRIVADVVTLTEIPAPPFKEQTRAKAYMEMLKAHGLSDVEMDAEGNVMGLRRGTGPAGGPLLVVTAHLDTVFPEGTDVKVRREGNKLSAPGIGDDTASLAVDLGLIRAMDAAKIKTKGDILFMGNVGEEGPGDLRGVRYLFAKGKYKDRIKYFISFEPGRERITNAGVGSKRYHVTFKGPGGHSYGAFGLVSPAYAMGDAMAQFGKIQVPAKPKTTYTVGLVDGGTSVNSIPFAMSMTVDMRSEGKAELKTEEDQFLAILPKAADAENAARSTANGKITFDNKLIGDRPVGATPMDAEIVKVAAAAVTAGGGKPSFGASSTDSNIPMSLGVQAVTLGAGFEAERAHAPDEYLTLDKPSDLQHMAIGLATVLALAGAEVR
jgi:tripeptide aminopeptidase